MKGPRARTGGIGEASAHAEFVGAVQALSRGPTSQEFETILIRLVDKAGFYRPPTLKDFIAKTGTAHGFDLHCLQHLARQEVVQIILEAANYSDEQLIALERAAIRERSLKA